MPNIPLLTESMSKGITFHRWAHGGPAEWGACPSPHGQLKSGLASSVCRNNVPWTWWHETPGIYSLTVLEARIPKSMSLGQNQRVIRATLLPEDIAENHSLPLPASGGWHSLPCSYITPIFKANILKSLSVPSPHPFLLCAWPIFHYLPHIRIHMIWLHLGPNQIIQENIPITRFLM